MYNDQLPLAVDCENLHVKTCYLNPIQCFHTFPAFLISNYKSQCHRSPRSYYHRLHSISTLLISHYQCSRLVGQLEITANQPVLNGADIASYLSRNFHPSLTVGKLSPNISEFRDDSGSMHFRIF
ncbi:hypothetical protein AVEN_221505-1 [Araneus ventricosus]|uniref:Uncharacterized protein n=1 Tax=Araneus ventricosus TaxID=182803 RepID=A0A4Y2DZZ3_ARAVE|nr:hypothetical protein AVEN_221505-1 [Araneus ventricosus]